MMGGMKRMQSQQPLLQQPHLQMQPPQHRDPVAQQHDELIKYIDEAWHKVIKFDFYFLNLILSDGFDV